MAANAVRSSGAAGAGRRAASRIIGLHGVSSFCLGMVFPFTGIYLAGQDAIGTGGVAVYYAMVGMANFCLGVLLATGVVRPPRYALAVAGTVTSMVGYLVLASAGSMPTVVVAGIANGAGHGCFLAAIIPIINGLVDGQDRREVFARRYQVLNATLAAGSLVAGLAVTALSRDFLRTLFVVNAIGYVPIAAVLLTTRRRTETLTVVDRPEGTALALGQLLRRAAGPTVFQFGAFLFGYSQFEATVPLVADTLLGVDLWWVSVLIALNVGVIVVAQGSINRLLDSRPETDGLRAAAAIWAVGYLAAALLAQGPDWAQIAGLLTFAAAFGLGECAYSCSFHPWLIKRVPDGELTRASALANCTMSVGLFSGPSIGVALAGSGEASIVFGALALLSISVAATTTGWFASRPADGSARQTVETAPATPSLSRSLPSTELRG